MDKERLIVKIVKTEKGNIDLVNADGNIFKNVPPVAILGVTQNKKLIEIRQQNDASFYIDPELLQATQVLPAAEVPFDSSATTIYELLALLRADFFFDLAGGGGASDNIYTADGTLTALRQLLFGGNNMQFGDLFGANDEPAVYWDVVDTLGEGKGIFLKAGDLNGNFGLFSVSFTGTPLEPRLNWQSASGNIVRIWEDFMQLKTAAGLAEFSIYKQGYIETNGGKIHKQVLEINAANYDLLINDYKVVALQDCTINLPDDPEQGTEYVIYSNGFNVTINPFGTQDINGAASLALTGFQSATLDYVISGVSGRWLTR